jgi:hypothetical protein
MNRCDAGCATASDWYTTTVNTPGLRPDVLQLVFDGNDRPRVLGYDDNGPSLVYAQCDGNCSVAANWGSVGLFDPGYYSSWDNGYTLRRDAQGRPRIAYYRADSNNNVLHYAWSNSNALTVTGWFSYTLNYPSNRDDWAVDLALDSQGRPRVTFASDKLDLSYLTCSANCESATPTWQQQYKDSQGNPQILYDAKGIRFARPGGAVTPTAPGSVALSGPTIGVVNISSTFTATVSPITATTPITYVWQATGLTTQTHTGRGTSDIASFTWPSGATGQKTITVSASNAVGAVSKSTLITIYDKPIQFNHWVYLPIVILS